MIRKFSNQGQDSGVHVKTGRVGLLHFSALLRVDGEKTPWEIEEKQMTVLIIKYLNLQQNTSHQSTFFIQATILKPFKIVNR